jgi:uncharacterized protein (TIGR02147 family)
MGGRFKKPIFEYDNYREFLKDAYDHLKSENSNFSFRYFSRVAGFKSPNILKLVMDGDRNLAPESIDQFAKGFKLNKEESHFFRNLVLLNQSKTSEQKQQYAEEIMKSRAYKKTHPLKESQYNFFGRWYSVLVRELVGLPAFKEDYDWIASQIQPSISAAEARRVVEELITLGLLIRDEQGQLKQNSKNVGTPDEVTSSVIANCHRELMKRASESIDTVPREKRDISALTFTVSEPTAAKIKEIIQKVRKEIMELAAHDGSPDSIYQLNFQLFPLVQTRENK